MHIELRESEPSELCSLSLWMDVGANQLTGLPLIEIGQLHWTMNIFHFNSPFDGRSLCTLYELQDHLKDALGI